MKHGFAALMALSLVSGGQAWATDSLALQIPGESGLKLAKLDKREHIARFLGTAAVAGRLVAQWVPDIDQSEPAKQEFRIYVDESAAKSLPAFEGYPVRKIDIENGLEALRRAVSSRTYRDFLRKKTLLVEASAVFRIQSYVVGVECDAQWARAIVTDVAHPELLAVARDPIRFGC